MKLITIPVVLSFFVGCIYTATFFLIYVDREFYKEDEELKEIRIELEASGAEFQNFGEESTYPFSEKSRKWQSVRMLSCDLSGYRVTDFVDNMIRIRPESVWIIDCDIENIDDFSRLNWLNLLNIRLDRKNKLCSKDFHLLRERLKKTNSSLELRIHPEENILC